MLLACAVVVGAVLVFVFSGFTDFGGPAAAATVRARPAPATSAGVAYRPPRPADAPAGIRQAVERGYGIVTEAGENAKAMVGNGLDCGACHFDGGITEGGRNGGISLVGVGAKYPAASPQGGVIDLADRTARCVTTNLNGKPPAAGSQDMRALLASFVYHNMPRQESPAARAKTQQLAPEKAIDVAAYLLSQPRPRGPK
jgi:cytochrome c